MWLVQVFGGYDANGKAIMINRTSKSPRKKDAEKLARELQTQHAKGELVMDKSTMACLLDDLVLDCKTRGKTDWVGIVVKAHLKPYFGHLRPEKITSEALRQYIAFRQSQGRANGTIMGELTVLRRAPRLAAESTPPKVGKIPKFPSLKRGAPRSGFLEHPQYLALREALPEELRPVLTYGYYTGSRKAEVLGLRWEQVNLSEGTVRLRAGETKNGEGRILPLVPELAETLAMQRSIRDRFWPECPWVFFRHATGEPLHDFRGAWSGACFKAGLWKGDEKTGEATVRFHDLRRSAARNLIRGGVPEVVAMRITGHKTRSIFDRYNIVSDTDLKDAAAKLSRYLNHREAETSTKLQHSPSGEPIQ